MSLLCLRAAKLEDRSGRRRVCCHTVPIRSTCSRQEGGGVMADVVLIAGLWMEASSWDDVARELEGLGHRPIPVRLPGADDRSTSATLEDQLAAVLEAVDSADHPVVVGHSAAASLAWMAADRRPDDVRQVMLVGGFPTPDGQPYADFDIEDGVMPFPGWGPFE